MRPADLATLRLATYRAGRLIADDRVTNPSREPFTVTEPDEYGVQEALTWSSKAERKQAAP